MSTYIKDSISALPSSRACSMHAVLPSSPASPLSHVLSPSPSLRSLPCYSCWLDATFFFLFCFHLVQTQQASSAHCTPCMTGVALNAFIYLFNTGVAPGVCGGMAGSSPLQALRGSQL